MKRAVIDLGTHTIVLLAVDLSGDGQLAVLREEERIVGLGRGAGGEWILTSEAIARTREALLEYTAILGRMGVDRVRFTATAVLRNARNSAEVKQVLEEAGHFPITIISGEEEARLVYLAAARTFPLVREKTVVDIGGGSTEVISGTAERVENLVSMPLGAVALTDRFLTCFPTNASETRALDAHIRSVFETNFAGQEMRQGALVGAAGTFTTAAAMEQGMVEYSPEKITGFKLKRPAVEYWIERLHAMTLDEQCHITGLHPKRAGYVVSGMHLIHALYSFFKTDEIIINDAGLRYGVLYDWLASDSRTG
ncbi:MAG: hypothetical protein A2268_07725 [Candidatus Raymondbacteria bacterium RifOxyA12_full_50_37]|uniref:Ppx/GppA phosphatase N-terminal domain-containing protein n=1 Tax=Candidatus Raymondbacteria bacterium RIFOXYD12_FULL_49_13 TaxID=1817890 RepID=A0A1F7F567_UNCRA|nr:MAG: hypothetical protein A2248_05335 [Candidatus Raymondbacteria bacterium RIFOXYA2_FULL_49_16]OGJ90129.1 MAG: hypothetical protein A2268_07725 [Candidatus Raymondbacteria bacterium RifOxyA12_full_50_37]OGJ92124.1 MAG: hypothetical protein A2350_08625 [Candidatus Raymondbacteria bacterium RifOxyB12_full_50_8]OGJ97707.1 MAG: hypothetical protein A2453_09695 [Candidatus Raymondbacteria bacterium RIFOXYC2_FULL_50_21]OGK01728.1 MAG: hypothetical protein A2519_22920 [Candidatus Raymondbacteria b